MGSTTTRDAQHAGGHSASHDPSDRRVAELVDDSAERAGAASWWITRCVAESATFEELVSAADDTASASGSRR